MERARARARMYEIKLVPIREHELAHALFWRWVRLVLTLGLRRK